MNNIVHRAITFLLGDWTTGGTDTLHEVKNSYGDVMESTNKYGQKKFFAWKRSPGNASASTAWYNYFDKLIIFFNSNAGRGYISVGDADGNEKAVVSSFEKSKLLGLDVQNEKIINVATPTLDTDAATKKYVDDNIGGKITVDEDNVTMSARTILSGTNLGSNADIIETLLTGGTAGQVLGVGPAWVNQTGGGGGSSKFKLSFYPASAESVGATLEAFIRENAGTYRNWSLAEFNDATEWNLQWIKAPCDTSAYAGGTITINIYWTAVAITGGVTWRVRLKGLTDGELMDVDFDSTTTHAVTTTVNGTTELRNKSTITAFTPSSTELTANDMWCVKLSRVVSDSGDTLSGVAKVIMVEILEN